MKAVVWRCHGLFASKSSAAAQEGNPGACALLKKSSVEGKGLDETTGACLNITKGRMRETPKRASLHSIAKDRPFELDGFHPAPGLLGSKNPWDQSAALPVAPRGLLDRNPLLGQGEERGVRTLRTAVSRQRLEATNQSPRLQLQPGSVTCILGGHQEHQERSSSHSPLNDRGQRPGFACGSARCAATAEPTSRSLATAQIRIAVPTKPQP
jgi:hypothetical protein